MRTERRPGKEEQKRMAGVNRKKKKNLSVVKEQKGMVGRRVRGDGEPSEEDKGETEENMSGKIRLGGVR